MMKFIFGYNMHVYGTWQHVWTAKKIVSQYDCDDLQDNNQRLQKETFNSEV